MHLRALTHSSVCSVISDLSMQDRNAPKAKDMNQRFLLLPTAPEGILRHSFLFTSNIQIMTTLETGMEPSSMSLSTTVPFQHSPGRHTTVYFNAWNNMSQIKVLLHHFNVMCLIYLLQRFSCNGTVNINLLRWTFAPEAIWSKSQTETLGLNKNSKWLLVAY